MISQVPSKPKIQAFCVGRALILISTHCLPILSLLFLETPLHPPSHTSALPFPMLAVSLPHAGSMCLFHGISSQAREHKMRILTFAKRRPFLFTHIDLHYFPNFSDLRHTRIVLASALPT